MTTSALTVADSDTRIAHITFIAFTIPSLRVPYYTTFPRSRRRSSFRAIYYLYNHTLTGRRISCLVHTSSVSLWHIDIRASLALLITTCCILAHVIMKLRRYSR